MDETGWQGELRRARERGRRARLILGVAPTAGRDELRRAYRRACRATHPDLGRGGDGHSEDFHLVRCAYEYLMHGAGGEALDAPIEREVLSPDGEYRVDNAWGYWCWWRQRFFHER